MKKEKLYFAADIDDEKAYTKSVLISEMKERNLEKIIVKKAIRELKTEYFFCKAVGEIGLKGDGYDPCGKGCDAYEPRNRVNGCCKYRGFCYEPGEKFILTNDGKLKPISNLR